MKFEVQCHRCKLLVIGDSWSQMPPILRVLLDKLLVIGTPSPQLSLKLFHTQKMMPCDCPSI